jgi:hypothetical protein
MRALLWMSPFCQLHHVFAPKRTSAGVQDRASPAMRCALNRKHPRSHGGKGKSIAGRARPYGIGYRLIQKQL